jgi:RNA-directed DNA polymerase
MGLVSPVDEGTPQEVVRDEARNALHHSLSRSLAAHVDVAIVGITHEAMTTRFITHHLKLKVNQAKSAVAQPGQREFLGFSFTGEREPRLSAPKAIARF